MRRIAPLAIPNRKFKAPRATTERVMATNPNRRAEPSIPVNRYRKSTDAVRSDPGEEDGGELPDWGHRGDETDGSLIIPTQVREPAQDVTCEHRERDTEGEPHEEGRSEHREKRPSVNDAGGVGRSLDHGRPTSLPSAGVR